MDKINTPCLMVAGTHSGVGKTLITAMCLCFIGFSHGWIRPVEVEILSSPLKLRHSDAVSKGILTEIILLWNDVQQRLQSGDSPEKLQQEQGLMTRLKQRVAYCQDPETTPRISTKGKTWLLTPYLRNSIMFRFLIPNREYNIVPHLDGDIGLIFYFVTKEGVSAYKVRSFKRDQPKYKGRNQAYAYLLGYWSGSLQEAQDKITQLELLHQMILMWVESDAVTLKEQGETEERRQRYEHEWMKLIKRFQQGALSITSNDMGNWSYESLPGRWFSIHGLEPKQEYQVLIEVKENRDIFLHLVHEKGVISFDLRNYINSLSKSKRSLTLHVGKKTTHGKTLPEAQRVIEHRHNLRQQWELLRRMVGLFIGETNEKNRGEVLQETLAQYRQDDPVSFDSSSAGECTWTIESKHYLRFHVLEPNQRYEVIPELDEGLGFILYFVSKDEVCAYTINESKKQSKGRRFLSAIKLGGLKGTVDELRNTLRQSKRFRRIIQSWADLKKSEQQGEGDEGQRERLQQELTQLLTQYLTTFPYLETRPGVKYGIFTPAPWNRIIFERLDPNKNYRIIPFLESDFGLVVYFVADTQVIAYGVNSYKDYKEDAGRTNIFYASHLGNWPLTWKEARAQFTQEGLLKKIIQLWGDWGKNEKSEGSQKLERIKKELIEKLREYQRGRLVVSASELGNWSITPVPNNRVLFGGLIGKEHEIVLYMEENSGLILYFVSENETVGYNVDSFKKYRLGRRTSELGRFSGRIRVRADSIEQARQIIRNLEWLQRTGKRPIVLRWVVIDPLSYRFTLQKGGNSPLAHVLRMEEILTVQRLLDQLNLTPREREQLFEIAELILAGQTIEQAAQQVGVPLSNVEKYWSFLRERLKDFETEGIVEGSLIVQL